VKLTGSHRIRLTSRAEAVARALRSAGWTVAELDGRQCGTKETLLHQLAIHLGLPKWFGHNWDALVDSLRTMTANGAGVAIVIDRAEHLDESSGVLVEIVEDLVAEGCRLGLHLRARPAFFRSAR
jgi:RNAse (barnase) inhibitor barstar